ncbi:MAG: CYTH domain-containing protein [Flavobacteriaceae bacterium]|nr:CYTH domain-containing protein [Flavobacteriaceae bacterium]
MQEHERKFLVNSNAFQEEAKQIIAIKQGFLQRDVERVIRIRIAGDRGWITIKGLSSPDGITRNEWEYSIPVKDAEALLDLCDPPIIAKERFIVPKGKNTYEVDVFHGENKGLIIAEIELSEPQEEFVKPEWLGAEVTGDTRYYNVSLLTKPYSTWD